MSSRMGSVNKLLLPYKGKTLIEYSLEQLIKTNIQEIIVVLGYQEEMVRNLIENMDARLKIVLNPSYKSGQTSSIQAGISISSKEAEGYMICLSDMPLLTHSHIMQLLEFRDSFNLANNPSIYRPHVKGVPGHPVILDSEYLPDLVNCMHPNGCRSVIKDHIAHLKLHLTKDEGFVADIDTMDAYHQLDHTIFPS